MGSAANTVLDRAQLNSNDIDIVIPHQANKLIIEALCEHAKIPLDKAFINIHKYGNTSAATVPIALCEAVEEGCIKPNSKILSAAFGAGLTWGATVIQWGERTTPVHHSDIELPVCEESAKDLLKEAVEHCMAQKEA